MNGETIVKVCRKCHRINSLDTMRCITCLRNDVLPVELLPNWLVEFERERQKV